MSDKINELIDALEEAASFDGSISQFAPIGSHKESGQAIDRARRLLLEGIEELKTDSQRKERERILEVLEEYRRNYIGDNTNTAWQRQSPVLRAIKEIRLAIEEDREPWTSYKINSGTDHEETIIPWHDKEAKP